MLTVPQSRLVTISVGGSANSFALKLLFRFSDCFHPGQGKGVNMEKPAFDIFRGAFDKDAVRVETVFGFSAARERMEQIAEAAPERYFVFGRVNQAVVARTDTRKSVVIR